MKPILFLLVLFLTLLISCGGSNDAQDSTGVYVTILDNGSGSPVGTDTVNVYYLVSQIARDTSYKSINYPNPFSTSTIFELTISKEEQTLVTLIEQKSNRVVSTVLNNTLQPGNHVMELNSDSISGSLKEGFYTLKVKTAESESNYEMLFLRSNYFGFNYSQAWVPAKVFNNPGNGKITLKPDDMPYIGRKFRHTAENGVILGDWIVRDSVSIEVLSDGYTPAYQTVELTQGKKTDITIRLIKK
jgi:hypothetical protein